MNAEQKAAANAKMMETLGSAGKAVIFLNFLDKHLQPVLTHATQWAKLAGQILIFIIFCDFLKAIIIAYLTHGDNCDR